MGKRSTVEDPMSATRNFMHAKFGERIGNALLRMGIYSIKDLLDHMMTYPHSLRNQWAWRHVGPASYQRILQVLCTDRQDKEMYYER